jgi:hypothetical protein
MIERDVEPMLGERSRERCGMSVVAIEEGAVNVEEDALEGRDRHGRKESKNVAEAAAELLLPTARAAFLTAEGAEDAEK